MTKKHYECSDKQMIFTILQMAFDHKLINGQLKPKDLESGKADWKDEGFYNLLCVEQDTNIIGQFANEDGEMEDYRISITKELGESWSPVMVVVASDVGFYSAEFSNTEFGCIVNYLKLKHTEGNTCLPGNI